MTKRMANRQIIVSTSKEMVEAEATDVAVAAIKVDEDATIRNDRQPTPIARNVTIAKASVTTRKIARHQGKNKKQTS